MIQKLDKGFFGVGCPHPSMECLVGQINKLLMHYGCNLMLGISYAQSLELLLVELGRDKQPL